MTRSNLSLTLLLSLLLLPAAAMALPEHVPGQVLIKFERGADRSTFLAEIGASRIKGFASSEAVLYSIEGLSVEQAMLAGRSETGVVYVEPNFIRRASLLPNDALFSNLWGLHNTGQSSGTPGADISADEAWSITTGSASVICAVMDTGVDWAHVDLAANIWSNPGETLNGMDDDGNGYIDDIRGWDFISDDNNPMDDSFHGTHVSGTVGAVGNNGLGVCGVNWTVAIMPIKSGDHEGSFPDVALIEGVDYAVANGARVINASLGGAGFSLTLKDAIQAANAAGVLFIAAAGNETTDNDVTPSYPANYDLPNIISVAATDRDDLLGDFSNWGATTVDLAAPGVAILSSTPGDNYGISDGTSMAAPHVAGAVALLLSNEPGLSVAQMRSRILGSVDVLPHLNGICVTSGRLNLQRMLQDISDIALDATEFTFQISLENQECQALTISNTGDGNLDWSIAARERVGFAARAMPTSLPGREEVGVSTCGFNLNCVPSAGGTTASWGQWSITTFFNAFPDAITLVAMDMPCSGGPSGPHGWVVWTDVGGFVPPAGDATTADFSGQFTPDDPGPESLPPTIYTYVDLSGENIVVPSGNYFSFGFQNTGSIGLIDYNDIATWSFFGGVWDADANYTKTAVLQIFFDDGTGPFWLSSDIGSGTVSPGGSQLLQICADATGLPAGQHLGELQITSNDPDESLLTLPADLFAYSTPVLLSRFEVETGPGSATITWELSEESDPADFRLMGVVLGASWELAAREESRSRFVAVDGGSRLAEGGEVTYSLHAREPAAGWRLLRSETVTVPALAAVTDLLTAHPNPFNPTVTIPFRLADEQRARLIIYDISGRRVALLADGEFDAGETTLVWDGRDAAGRAASTGVYFVRLETAGFGKSQKLVLLR